MEVGIGQQRGQLLPRGTTSLEEGEGSTGSLKRNSQDSQVIPGTREIVLEELALGQTDRLSRKGLAFPINCLCLLGTQFRGVKNPLEVEMGNLGRQEFKVSLGYICSSRPSCTI